MEKNLIDIIIERVNYKPLIVKPEKTHYEKKIPAYLIYEFLRNSLISCEKQDQFGSMILIHTFDNHFLVERTYPLNCGSPTKIIGIGDTFEEADKKAYNYIKSKEVQNMKRVLLSRKSLGKIIEKLENPREFHI